MKTILKSFNSKTYNGIDKVVITKNDEIVNSNVRVLCTDRVNINSIVVLALDKNSEQILTFNLQNEGVNFTKLKIERRVFEEGDIIAFGVDIDNPIIGIVKSLHDNMHDDYFDMNSAYVDGYAHGNGNGWFCNNMRPATEEEKQRLFNILLKGGKKWNSEKKCIEYISQCSFKRGQAVLVKINDCYWNTTTFIDYKPELAFPYITSSGFYKQCVDYDSNKNLILTNNNLKQIK